MDDGTALDFSIDPPAFVKAAVAESVKRWRWRKVGKQLQGTDPDRLGQGSSIEAIFRLVDPRKSAGEQDWGPTERAALCSAVTNRQWI